MNHDDSFCKYCECWLSVTYGNNDICVDCLHDSIREEEIIKSSLTMIRCKGCYRAVDINRTINCEVCHRAFGTPYCYNCILINGNHGICDDVYAHLTIDNTMTQDEMMLSQDLMTIEYNTSCIRLSDTHV